MRGCRSPSLYMSSEYFCGRFAGGGRNWEEIEIPVCRALGKTRPHAVELVASQVLCAR